MSVLFCTAGSEHTFGALEACVRILTGRSWRSKLSVALKILYKLKIIKKYLWGKSSSGGVATLNGQINMYIFIV